jgi:hypothetical protein
MPGAWRNQWENDAASRNAGAGDAVTPKFLSGKK